MGAVKTPWKDSLGDLPFTLEYFQGSMSEGVERQVAERPHFIALDFMGRTTTYREMQRHIEECARSRRTLGIRPGDVVTIAMPNCPQIVYMFYAVNMIGAIASMVHPLSSEKELEEQNIGQNTIRLSVGTEHIDDIIADLENGFRAI